MTKVYQIFTKFSAWKINHIGMIIEEKLFKPQEEFLELGLKKDGSWNSKIKKLFFKFIIN